MRDKARNVQADSSSNFLRTLNARPQTYSNQPYHCISSLSILSMAYTKRILLLSTALIHLAASRALAPLSAVPDDLLQFDQPRLATRNPATALDSSESDAILQSALDAPDPLSVLRNTTQELNFVYECDGDRYGHNLPLLSCIDALKLVADVNAKFRFGPRTEGRMVNFKTPYRFLSSK